MIASEEKPTSGLRALRTPLDIIILITAVYGIYEVLQTVGVSQYVSLTVATACVILLVAADYFLSRRGVSPYFRLFGFTRVPRSALVLASSIEVDVAPPPTKPQFEVRRDYVFTSSPRVDECFDTLEDSTADAGQAVEYSCPDARVASEVRSSPGRLTVYWTPNTSVRPFTLYTHSYRSSLQSRLDGEGNFYIVSHAYPAGHSRVRIRTWRPILHAACYATREAYFDDERVFRGALEATPAEAVPGNFSFSANEIDLSLGLVNPGTRVYIAWTHDVGLRDYWIGYARLLLKQRVGLIALGTRLERRRVRRLLATFETREPALGAPPQP